MVQAVWSGSLGFGLVDIPVKLYNAISPKDVRFHQFERGSQRRIRHARIAEAWPSESHASEALDRNHTIDGEEPAASGSPSGGGHPGQSAARGKEDGPRELERPPGAPPSNAVAHEDVIKGYEVDRGRYALVDPEELRAIAPEQTHTIDIEDFVDLSDIDPVYFEKSYYVVPQRGKAAEKPYWLLLTALDEAEKVGIGRFVLRTKEYLAAIRPMNGILGLGTMYFSDEVRGVEELPLMPAEVSSDREVKMARRLIESLSTEWVPDRYGDAYRERVMELLDSRAGKEIVVAEEEPPLEAGAADLMEALRASVDAAKAAKARRSRGPKRTRRTG